MPSKITFKIATKEGPIEKTGYVANFKIGNKTVKFVMQDYLSEACALTHFASGYIIIHGNAIAALKVSHYMHNPYAKLLTNRKACETLLNELVNQHGAEKIMKKLETAPIINS